MKTESKHSEHPENLCPECGRCEQCDEQGCICLGIDQGELEFWMFGDGQP